MGDAAGYHDRQERNPPPDCIVTPVAINFNHDPGWMHADAMNIRVNATRAVEVPEWTPGKTRPEQSPAAYALEETHSRAREITIRAQFIIHPWHVPSAEVRTKPGTGGILGAIEPTQVKFRQGVSREDEFGGGTFVPLVLKNNRLHQRGAITREDIAWEWEYRCPGEKHWHSMHVTTRHRIYVTLRAPQAPWNPADPAKHVWTDVLDHVCKDEADGARNETQAANRIARHIYEGHGAQYDQSSRGPAYYADRQGGFDLTRYLGNVNALGKVTCYDQAIALATFSASVGCPMEAVLHDPFGYLPRVLPVGRGLTNNPFSEDDGYAWPGCAKKVKDLGPLPDDDEICRSFFRNHAYCRLRGKVYDATMKTQGGWLLDMAQDQYEDAAIDDSLATDHVATGPDASGVMRDWRVNEKRVWVAPVGSQQPILVHPVSGRGIAPRSLSIAIR